MKKIILIFTVFLFTITQNAFSSYVGNYLPPSENGSSYSVEFYAEPEGIVYWGAEVCGNTLTNSYGTVSISVGGNGVGMSTYYHDLQSGMFYNDTTGNGYLYMEAYGPDGSATASVYW